MARTGRGFPAKAIIIRGSEPAAADTPLAVDSAAFDIDGQSVGLQLTWSISVTAAEFSAVGQTVVLNGSPVVESTAFSIVGQSVAFDLDCAVAAAEFDIAGQDVTLTVTNFLVIAVDAAAFGIVGQPIDLIAIGQGQQVSGGYGFKAGDRTLHLRKRRREELEEQERKELADRLEAVMLAEGSITKAKADLIRLRGLVNEYDELPNRVKRAAAYAERARTEQALQLALREIQRLQEEEELSVHLALMFD